MRFFFNLFLLAIHNKKQLNFPFIPQSKSTSKYILEITQRRSPYKPYSEMRDHENNPEW